MVMSNNLAHASQSLVVTSPYPRTSMAEQNDVPIHEVYISGRSLRQHSRINYVQHVYRNR